MGFTKWQAMFILYILIKGNQDVIPKERIK